MPTSKSILKKLQQQNKLLSGELRALALIAEASTDSSVQKYANLVLRGMENDKYVKSLTARDALAEPPVQLELELDAERYDFLRKLGLHSDEVVDAAMRVYEDLDEQDE